MRARVCRWAQTCACAGAVARFRRGAPPPVPRCPKLSFVFVPVVNFGFINLHLAQIHSFDLYNAIGELMLKKSELNSKSITINRNELKSGIYISKITDANGNSVVRNIIFE